MYYTDLRVPLSNSPPEHGLLYAILLRPVIKSSSIIVVWEGILVLGIIYTAVVLPLTIGFGFASEVLGSHMRVVNVVADSLFVIDVYVSARMTQMRRDGNYEFDPLMVLVGLGHTISSFALFAPLST